MPTPEFAPDLKILPTPQRLLWPELGDTPERFTLYGGTALALQLGHRTSVDFDFFSWEPFDPDSLAKEVSYLSGGQRVQVAPNTLTYRVERSGPILMSFFGGLEQGVAAPRLQVEGLGLYVASLLDLAGTKASVVQKRAEAKDYLDIDALLRHGIDLPTILASAKAVFGDVFNPLITLKALTYFDDLPSLPRQARLRLEKAANDVNVSNLPTITPYIPYGTRP